jgi:hypothetical protein
VTLLLAYLSVALLVGCLGYLDLRRTEHDVVSNLLLAFALGVFWPMALVFGLTVGVLILVRDRQNGAP